MTDQEKLTKLRKELDSLEENSKRLYDFLRYYDDDNDPIYKTLEANSDNTNLLQSEYNTTYEKLHPTAQPIEPTPTQLKAHELWNLSQIIWELEKVTENMANFMKDHTVTQAYTACYCNFALLLNEKQHHAKELRHELDIQF